MRKALILLLLFPLGCLGQEISLEIKNATLEDAFKEIQRKTDYRFVYTREEIEGAAPVNIKVQKTNIDQLLLLLFKEMAISYSIEQNFIILHKKDNSHSLPGGLIDVAGTVRNEEGKAIAGATVTLKGGRQVTATNEAGEFLLKAVDEAGVLVVSSIGYSPREISIAKRKQLTIELKLQVSSLDETVVVAYGSTTRRLNTGSVSKVSGRDIERQPVSNPLAALQGRASGLLITQSNGLPGSRFRVQIRGQYSIQQGNAPLYVLDGVPFLSDADVLTQRSQLQANSPFNTLNPADIESIEILKDADATAIYGSLGGNGVILITTKRGKTGKTKVDVSHTSGWGKVSRTVDYLNTEEYLLMRREAFANDGVTPTVANAPDLIAWSKERFTDWKEVLIGGTAQTNNTNVRLSGGNSLTNYALSGNYYKETTVFPGDHSNSRGSVYLSVGHTSSNNRFTALITSSYGSDKSQLIPQDLTQYINLPPNAPVLYDASGKLNWKEGGAAFSNPLAGLEQDYDVHTDRLSGSGLFSYEITKGLNIKANVGYNEVSADEQSLNPIASQNPDNGPKGSAVFGNSKIKSWLAEPQLHYKTTAGKKNKLEALAGWTWRESVNKNYLLSGSEYTNDALLESIAGAAPATVTATNSYALYRYTAIFGRLQLNREDKYLLNLTARRDGSSRFGPGKRFAWFGAAGAGWNFYKEGFQKKVLPFLSFGKLRGSYGLTGNDQIGDYQYLDSWTPTLYGYQGQSSLMPARLFNPDYSWEQTKKAELAVELGFFKDRILVTVNSFYTRSDNQIILYSLPAQTGFTRVLRNFPGVVTNRGLETEILATPIRRGDFEWKTTFNLTVARNRLNAFPNLETSAYARSYIVGKPLNIRIGYDFLGVNSNTGVYQFDDKNRDGNFDFSDQGYLGTTNPDYYGGLTNNIRFKNWELDFLFQFQRQQGINAFYGGGIVGGMGNQPRAVLDRWPGTNADFQKYTQGAGSPAAASINFLNNSSALLTDASFIRLKNASLYYSLPGHWLKKTGAEACRLGLQGQNLLVFTKYKGADPENQSLRALPPLRLIAFNAQLTF